MIEAEQKIRRVVAGQPITAGFPFQRYIKGGWYFNLLPQAVRTFPTAYFNSKYIKIPDEYRHLLKEDTRYTTSTAREIDLGYQAWNRGIMLLAEEIEASELRHHQPTSLEDNYIYLRKYYKKEWSYFVLLSRLLALRNPFAELSAFFRASKISRYNLYDTNADYAGYDNFNSSLVDEQPLVSVIIPTLNRYIYLKDVLEDLEVQDYRNFEIIVIDQTDEPDKVFYEQFNLNLRVMFQEGKGQWLARNEAARQAKGNYLVFFDDDSRINNDWITQHLKGLDYFNADISAGVSLSRVGDVIPKNYSFFRWADQFDSGNAMVKRTVFEQIGLFDRQFDKQRMGDGEFGLRAYLAGFRSISHPYAMRIHLKVGSGGLRQMGSWDGFRPKKFFAPRPVPSVIYLYRKYFPISYVRRVLLTGILPSLIPYHWKHKKHLYPLAAIFSLFILPILLLQFYISWSAADKMLKQGDKIEWL